MAKVNKIVNFGTAAYQGRSHCSIVDSSARANFYIIFKNNIAYLRNMRMNTIFCGKTKTFTTDNCFSTQYNAFTQNTVLMYDSTRIDVRIFPNSYIMTNIYIRSNRYIITDNSIIINNTIGTNSYIFTKCNILANNSSTMHFTGNYNRWMEYF